jgi:hypothetical protein
MMYWLAGSAVIIAVVWAINRYAPAGPRRPTLLYFGFHLPPERPN